MTQPGAIPVRNAATVLLVRDRGGPKPAILMGQRSAEAVFLPGKFVFPGGAVDVSDAGIPFAATLDPQCRSRIKGVDPDALAAAAIRELWEETGLILGQRGDWTSPPQAWAGFAERGLLPDASCLRFVFRAITPPGRPRRFDARFFVADADRVSGSPDDFSNATDELAHLQWIPISEAFRFDLPFITQCVLAEVAGRLPTLEPPETIPFFDNNDEQSLFLRINGRSSRD